jgi:hypothetical protein
MTLLLLLIVRNFVDPSAGAFLTKCSKNHVPTTKGPTNHNLEDCHMLRRYFESLGIKKDDKKEDPKGDDKDERFPEIHDYFMIYGGPSMHLSTWQHKREHREVFSVQLATPLFLDWSEVAITFDRDEHLDYVPNPRVYPACRRSHHRQHTPHQGAHGCGSSLNIIYAETLDLLEITRTHL